MTSFELSTAVGDLLFYSDERLCAALDIVQGKAGMPSAAVAFAVREQLSKFDHECGKERVLKKASGVSDAVIQMALASSVGAMPRVYADSLKTIVEFSLSGLIPKRKVFSRKPLALFPSDEELRIKNIEDAVIHRCFRLTAWIAELRRPLVTGINYDSVVRAAAAFAMDRDAAAERECRLTMEILLNQLPFQAGAFQSVISPNSGRGTKDAVRTTPRSKEYFRKTILPMSKTLIREAFNRGDHGAVQHSEKLWSVEWDPKTIEDNGVRRRLFPKIIH